MTQPSELLDAVALRLRTELQPLDPVLSDGSRAQPVDVQVTDRMLDDVADVVTFRAPAVVISCTGLGEADRSLGSLSAPANLVARCYARLPVGPSDTKTSAGDVAMNLAALVAQIVEEAPFRDADGKDLSIRAPSNVRIMNRTVEAIAQRGHAMWSVTWSQRIELTPRDRTAALHAFKRLHIDIEMQGQAPDQALTIELEGRDP